MTCIWVFGLLAALTFLQIWHFMLCGPHKLSDSLIHYFCNNLGIITNITSMLNLTIIWSDDTSNNNHNVYLAILNALHYYAPQQLSFLHVLGHKDKDSKCNHHWKVQWGLWLPCKAVYMLNYFPAKFHLYKKSLNKRGPLLWKPLSGLSEWFMVQTHCSLMGVSMKGGLFILKPAPTQHKRAPFQHKRAPLPRKGAHHSNYKGLDQLKIIHLQLKYNISENIVEKRNFSLF